MLLAKQNWASPEERETTLAAFAAQAASLRAIDALVLKMRPN
jgi:hypothetical protein